ncbi:MAG: hypothetical protein R3324_19165 [Halobacteriales archaeon]|nr:hypothetical protein [Halobacteriales archaeon]
MNVDTIRTEPKPEPAAGARRVVDVSELRADSIESFADGGAVHLERRGGKTYLVADG